VAAAGIATQGQAMVHILLKADARRRRGARAASRPPADLRADADWIGELPAVARDKAVAELGRRYLAAHSPADSADLSRWAGIRLGDAKAALREAGARGLTHRAHPAAAAGNRSTPTSWAGRTRSFAVPPEHEKMLLPGGGMFRAVAIDDGVVVGDWAAVSKTIRASSGSGRMWSGFSRLRYQVLGIRHEY